VPETALLTTDLDLISFLKAIPDARMRRGIRIPAWYLLLVGGWSRLARMVSISSSKLLPPPAHGCAGGLPRFPPAAGAAASSPPAAQAHHPGPAVPAAGHGRYQPWHPCWMWSESRPTREFRWGGWICSAVIARSNRTAARYGERTAFPDAARHRQFNGDLNKGDGDAMRLTE
jgi:hypothetical protein